MRFSYFTAGGLWLVFAILAFGDFGFDHAGRFGFDFGDAIVVLVIYALVLLVAIAGVLLSLFDAGSSDFRWRWWLFDVVLIVGSVACHYALGIALKL